MIVGLPTELLLCILRYLDPGSILTVLATHPSLACLDQDGGFWHGLATIHGVSYRHPSQTWRDLCLSGDIYDLCPHLSALTGFEPGHALRMALFRQSYAMCLACGDALFMRPSSQQQQHTNNSHPLHSIHDDDKFKTTTTPHPAPQSAPSTLHSCPHATLVSLSPSSFMNVICRACNRPVILLSLPFSFLFFFFCQRLLRGSFALTPSPNFAFFSFLFLSLFFFFIIYDSWACSDHGRRNTVYARSRGV